MRWLHCWLLASITEPGSIWLSESSRRQGSASGERRLRPRPAIRRRTMRSSLSVRALQAGHNQSAVDASPTHCSRCRWQGDRVPSSTPRVRFGVTKRLCLLTFAVDNRYEQACTAWRLKAEAVTEQREPSLPERKLSCNRTPDGTLIGGFTFDGALATAFEKALGIAITWEGKQDTRTTSVRQADAMFDIVSFFNANHAGEGTPRHRAHVELGIDAEHLGDNDCHATTVDGHPLPASTTDAFLCDSIIQRFVLNGSVPIDIGRASRTVPVHLYRAVAQRDGGCRHPGCDRKIAWCDAHHIRYWRHNGDTNLDNLVLLCARHHHLIHRPGWQLKLLPDATVEVTTPDGRTLTSQPRPRLGQRLKHLKPRT
jgi:Domain of unknown function (DUF222)